MTDETSERLQRVEASLAHLENQVEQLNEVVIEQGKVIERLKEKVQKQSTAIKTLELERIKSNNPKPAPSIELTSKLDLKFEICSVKHYKNS